jgi:glycosyltransferase involved in cell wall biosynthesis
MKTVSVVIASSRPSETLKQCVASVWAQTVKPLEVIVVTDTPIESDINATFLHTNSKGPTAARNLGISHSSGDIIAFIDDDARTGSIYWIETISQTKGVVGGPSFPPPTMKIPQKWWWMFGCSSTHPLTKRPFSCNMAVSREIFHAYGNFKEVGLTKMKYPMGEETEFLKRLPKNLIVWNTNMWVYHDVSPHRQNLRYMMKRGYREGVSKAILRRGKLENDFLWFYLTHPDRYTIPVLLSVFVGFVRGKI